MMNVNHGEAAALWVWLATRPYFVLSKRAATPTAASRAKKPFETKVFHLTVGYSVREGDAYWSERGEDLVLLLERARDFIVEAER